MEGVQVLVNSTPAVAQFGSTRTYSRPTTGALHYHVIIVGAGVTGLCAGAELLRAGITNFVILDKTTGVEAAGRQSLDGYLKSGQDILSAVFDADNHMWTIGTSNDTYRGRVVITAPDAPLAPWIPELAGRNDFQGFVFHAAERHPDFDPRGKRVAVVGADTTAGEMMTSLADSAASVRVFTYPPRRITAQTQREHARARVRHWTTRFACRTPELVRAPIENVSARGLRTTDGVDHDVDAIVYATGYATPKGICGETMTGTAGLTLEQAWKDGVEPYCGVAVHGFPNWFVLSGPNFLGRTRYIVRCLQLMTRAAATRIEVRRSRQQMFNEQVHLRRPAPHPLASDFDLSSHLDLDDGVYDGNAILTLAGTSHPVNVRLTGHLEPIDGRYHWRGMVLDPLPAHTLTRTRTAQLTVHGLSAPVRIAEDTPWGGHTLVGVGAPPFAAVTAALAMTPA